MIEQNFIGTWRLIAMEARTSDGEVTYPFGSDAHGFILYAPDGYMSVVICASSREPFGTSDLLAGAEEQLAAAAGTYISYAGRYELEHHRVRHTVEVSLFPDWVGTTQERTYQFEDQRLTLRTDPIPLAGRESWVTLIWERVAPHT